MAIIPDGGRGWSQALPALPSHRPKRLATPRGSPSPTITFGKTGHPQGSRGDPRGGRSSLAKPGLPSAAGRGWGGCWATPSAGDRGVPYGGAPADSPRGFRSTQAFHPPLPHPPSG